MAALQVLDKIQNDVINSGFDQRYKIAAYDFVLNGLEFYLTEVGEKRHVSGQEFSIGLLQFAFKQFGLFSLRVLKYWGITKTDDFGHIVYNMINIGLMSRKPEDVLEDFSNVIDIESFFQNQNFFEIDKYFIKRIKGA